MKTSALFIKSLMIASLTIMIPSIAGETQSVLEESDAVINGNEECGIDLLPPPEPITKGEVSYVSGGICTGGVAQIKDMIKQFPLEVVLVEKNKEYNKENYLADVKVVISNVKNEKTVLDVYTDGPYLLVNLPDGRYRIKAEYNKINKEDIVNISHSQHKRVVFLWPDQTTSE